MAQVDRAAGLAAVGLGREAGRRSAEPGENMPNRLKPGPMPPPVETPLTLSEVPIADTGRYDRLRTEVTDHA